MKNECNASPDIAFTPGLLLGIVLGAAAVALIVSAGTILEHLAA